MPRGDRTGPNGMGSRTGRAMGFCNGYDAPGYANPGAGFGRGFGRGAGFGRCFGRGMGRAPMNYTPRAMPTYEYTKEDEIADLKYEKDAIKRELESIEKRLKELENKK